MKKKHTDKLAENPRHIPGIYNYCDRWCERCQFTSQCLNFEIAEEQFGDLQDEAFWQRLTESLQTTIRMVKGTAEEKGIDLDSIDSDGELENPFEEKPVIHIISHMAETYADMVDDWFEIIAYLFDEMEEDYLEYPEFQEEIVSIAETAEIIRWYQHQIYVKLMRGIKSDQRKNQFGPDDYFGNSDGSVKVALIGIDRSISAWDELLKQLPGVNEDTVKLINYLDRLRQRVENEFPNARAFVRPGFDDS